MHALIEFYRLLLPAERRRFGFLLVLITAAAIVDVAGIASIGPFLALLANPAASGMRGLSELRSFAGATDDRAFVVLVGLSSLVLIVLSNGLNAWASSAQVYFTNAISVTLARRLLDGYLSQDQAVLLNQNSTELGKNILSEVERIMLGVMMPAITLIARGTAAVLIVILLMLIDPVLALFLALAFGGAYVAVYAIVQRRLTFVGRAAIEGNNRRFRIVTEAFGALRELRLYGRVHAFVQRFDQPAAAHAQATATSLVIGQLPRYVLEPLAFASIVAIVIYAIRTGSDLAGVAPLVGLFAFAGYRLMPAFQHLFGAVSAIRLYLPSLRPIIEGLSIERSLDVEPRGSPGQRIAFNDRLELRGVSFVYADGTRTLDKLDLTIPAHTTVGIIGRTGSGKTTLVSVILGLLAPSAGAMSVDGVALQRTNLRGWQRHLGYVPQEVFLVDDTILANIALGVPRNDIDRAAVERAARLANMHDFIVGLPAGYDTPAGERGARLSGGQRQRIGIARALYHEPDVVVFDEATSGLDSETEDAVMSAIDGLAGDRTLIIVAHRPGALRRASVVHLLDRGRVVASGSLKELQPMLDLEGAAAG